mgnify:CR=1 FL=1
MTFTFFLVFKEIVLNLWLMQISIFQKYDFKNRQFTDVIKITADGLTRARQVRSAGRRRKAGDMSLVRSVLGNTWYLYASVKNSHKTKIFFIIRYFVSWLFLCSCLSAVDSANCLEFTLSPYCMLGWIFSPFRIPAYSTVTLFARFLGLSTSRPFATDT